MRPSWLLLVVRCVVGAFFVYSGMAKALEPAEFLKLLRLYELTGEPVILNLIGAALPWFEIFCGVLLIGGVAVRGTALVTTTMLVLFTVVVLLRALVIQETSGLALCAIRFDCGCGAGEVAVCRKLAENGVLILFGLGLVAGAPSRYALRHSLFGGR
jgi:uncharacterized membrane protein YphA (DoxX/SURF4 family)